MLGKEEEAAAVDGRVRVSLEDLWNACKVQCSQRVGVKRHGPP